jgi:hypothetical protein
MKHTPFLSLHSNITSGPVSGGQVKANVSKTLADSDDLASEPCETRTRDTLIKSQVLYQLS